MLACPPQATTSALVLYDINGGAEMFPINISDWITPNVPTKKVEQFIEKLSDIIGAEITHREVNQALKDLNMDGSETRPFALRLLRRQLESNLSGVFGSTVARQLVADVKKMADEKYNPDGYNVGINFGKWAGQSIPHLHIHVIPRYRGDVENPKGGVRGVIPKNKLYTFNPD